MKSKSQKGKRNGQVGAPPKDVKFPRGKFIVDKAEALNPDVCELTVRKRVMAAVKGFYFTGTGDKKRKVIVPKTLKIVGKVPQPDGKVGRPAFLFGPAEVKPKATKLTAPKQPKSVPVTNVASTPQTNSNPAPEVSAVNPASVPVTTPQ